MRAVLVLRHVTATLFKEVDRNDVVCHRQLCVLQTATNCVTSDFQNNTKTDCHLVVLWGFDLLRLLGW